MQDDQHSHTLRNDNDDVEPDLISPSWLVIGSALFIATLAAPVAVVHMGSESIVPAPTTEIAEYGQATPESSDIAQADAASVPLREQIAEGPIDPGVGLGNLQLGDEIDAVLATISEPPTLSFDASDDGIWQNHDYRIEDIQVMLRSNPDVGRIDSLQLAAMDCETVRTFQPRQDGLPQTKDGITIGSHVSRVITRFGEPEQSSTGEAAPLLPGETVEHVYPGMVMHYCQEDMLISSISVVHRPEMPADVVPPNTLHEPPIPTPVAGLMDAQASDVNVAIATAPNTGGPDLYPDLPATSPSLGAAIAFLPRQISDDFAASDMPDEPKPAATRADRAPRVDRPTDDAPQPSGQSGLQLAEATSPDAAPDVAIAMPLPNIPTDDLEPQEPEPLLALQGGAYTLSDAFPADSSTRSDDSAAIASDTIVASVPVLEDAKPVAPTPPLILAQAWESDLALSSTQQRTIQIRLGLIGLDPRGADGIFGPNTREAILKMQERFDLPATGYLDGSAKTTLERETRRAFASFQKKQKRAQRRAAKQSSGPVLVAQVPPARRAPECARDSRGKIIQNQNFSCDSTLLGESLNGLGSAVSSLFSGRS